MTHPIAIGTVLEVKDAHQATNQFVVEGYNEQSYMKLVMKNNAAVLMTIHPEHAKRIAEKGIDSGIKVLNALTLNDVVVKVTEAIVVVPTPSNHVVVVGSKKARAMEIKQANPTATRKQLIEVFISQLGMTPAGASTYASMKG